MEGQVEAEGVTDRLDLLGRRALALGVHDLHGVAGDEVDQKRHAMVVTTIVRRPMPIRRPMKLNIAPAPWEATPADGAGVADAHLQNFTSLKIG